MATNVIMPALGMDQETGTLVRWIKREGDLVTRGESIMEIETDKVLVEIEANASGILSNITAEEGDEIPVGQVIAQILEPGEAPRPGNAPSIAGTVRAGTAESIAPTPVASSIATASTPSEPSAREGTLTPASPLARRLAQERGLEVASLAGSGPEGAVTAADVFAAQVSAASAPVAPPPANLPPPSLQTSSLPEPAAPMAGEPISVGRAWQVMAERMTQSWTTAPHFVLMREVDASALMEMRARIILAVEKRFAVRPTYTDLLVKLVASALRAHPRLNASWHESQVRGNDQVNIGIATALEEALVVPVIHGADHLSVGDIATRRRDLVDRAATGKLTPNDVAAGTFTITNLGTYGVDGFNAIINPPQAAILAVGRIADRVVAVDGQPAVRPTVILTVSCDHRVVDGARAARFLDELATLIEEPWGLLA